MSSGKITQFGTFDQVRESGDPFALASLVGESAEVETQQAKKDDAFDSVSEEEEVDEELLWTNDKNKKWAAFRFFFGAVGIRECIILGSFVLLLAAVQAGLQGYLQRECFLCVAKYAATDSSSSSSLRLREESSNREVWRLDGRIRLVRRREWNPSGRHVLLLHRHPHSARRLVLQYRPRQIGFVSSTDGSVASFLSQNHSRSRAQWFDEFSSVFLS